MAQYIIVYFGGEPPSSPEEGQAHMEKYKAWMAGLGDAIVSPANPCRNTSTVAPDGSVSGGSASGMSGYTLIEAESMDAALDMAKSCPFLDIGGTLEVSEKLEMSFAN